MIIAADWVFPVTSAPLQRHAIEIEDKTIRDIRPVRSSDNFLENTCLLPGLVNTHTHLAYTIFRNSFDQLEFFPWIRKLTEAKKALSEKEIRCSTRNGIIECLHAGITTVADLSDYEIAVDELSNSPLRGIFYWEIFGIEQTQAVQSWRSLKEVYPRLKQQYGSDRLRIGVSPHSCYTVRPELYALIAEWAVEEDIPVSFHAAESNEEEQFITKRKGPIHDFLKDRAADWKISRKSSISHLEATGIFRTKPLIAHAVQATEKDLDILRTDNVSVAHCPKSNAKFGHGIAPITDMLKKGIRLGLGTDSAASNNRLDLFEEARFCLFLQRGHAGRMLLNEQQMLELMTIGGAKAMRMEREIGSLQIGKKADIIAVTIPSHYQEPSQVFHHLIYNTSSNDVSKTFIDGKEIDFPRLEAGR